MKPDPKQLALMISLIGLGLTAAQPARAQAPLFVYAEPVLPAEADPEALPDPARPMAAWVAEIPLVQAPPVVPAVVEAAEALAEPEDRLGHFIGQVLNERAAVRAAAAQRAVAVVPPQALPDPEPLAPVAAPQGSDTATGAARIVVATTTDTVLRGLEALIGATPLADNTGRDELLTVNTQSEKVLATLAQILPAAEAHPFGPVAEAERLDTVRGGFTTPAGLQFSFGIERAVYVNGDLVATTRLNLSNLKQDIEQRVAESVGGLVVLRATEGAGTPRASSSAPRATDAASTSIPAPSPGPMPSAALAAAPAAVTPPPPSPAPKAGAPAQVPVPIDLNLPKVPAPAPAPVMVIHTGGPLGVVQVGPGNSLPAGGLGGSAVGTVIQNTLNDQMIQNVLTVNATVNSLQVLKSFDIHSAVRSAIQDALRR